MPIQRIGTSPIVAYPASEAGEDGADAYLDFCTEQHRLAVSNPNALWYYPRNHPQAYDARGQRIVALFGPGTSAFGTGAPHPDEEATRLASGGVLGLGIDREVEEE